MKKRDEEEANVVDTVVGKVGGTEDHEMRLLVGHVQDGHVRVEMEHSPTESDEPVSLFHISCTDQSLF